MSGPTSTQPSSTTKPTSNEAATTDKPAQTTQQTSTLEEDDEFEDFPVEDWPDEETVKSATENLAGTATGGVANTEGDKQGNAHLWEESWDDDDASDDFASMLREELRRVEKK